MGIVYEAYDTQLDRPVALKMLAPELSHNAEATQIFEAEARIMARVRHPHLVSVYDVVRDDVNKRTCLVMEYIEGQTLEDRIFNDGRFFDLQDGISLSLQLMAALTYLHDRGIVHRDIKPANIMLETDGSLRVMDFGLARNLRELIQRGTRVRGTPAYMAPEQVMGHELSTRTDLYAAGITLFEMFAGTLPFRGDDLTYHHMHTTAPDIRARRPDVPVVVALLISACLQKDPAMRPDSALAIMQDMVSGLDLHDRPWPAAVISALNMRPSLSHSAMLHHPSGDGAPYDSRDPCARPTRDAPRHTHQHPLPGAAVHHSLFGAAPSPQMSGHDLISPLQPPSHDTRTQSRHALRSAAARWTVPLTLTTLAMLIGFTALTLSDLTPPDAATTPKATQATIQATTAAALSPAQRHNTPEEGVVETHTPPAPNSQGEAGQVGEVIQAMNHTMDFAEQATAQQNEPHRDIAPDDATAPDDAQTPGQRRDTQRADRPRRQRTLKRMRTSATPDPPGDLIQTNGDAQTPDLRLTDEHIHAEHKPDAPPSMTALTTPPDERRPPDALSPKADEIAETPRFKEPPTQDKPDAAAAPSRTGSTTEGPRTQDAPPAPKPSQPARPYGF